MNQTPAAALMSQIATIQDAIEVLRTAVDDITGNTDPDTASWKDVSKYAHLIDGLRRGDILSEG